MVTPIIPKNTAVPSACRISAPGPDAITSGTTPRMKAKLVIRIGRNRVRAASSAAAMAIEPAVLGLFGKFDDQDGVFRRQPDEYHQPDLREDVVVEAAQIDPEDGGKQAHRHDHDHRQRQHQRFILGGEQQEDEHHGKHEHRRCGIALGFSPDRQARSIHS